VYVYLTRTDDIVCWLEGMEKTVEYPFPSN